MIYLDNAASSIIHDDVLDMMLPFLREQYGNPSSIHRYGRRSKRAIEHARSQIAALINANPSTILLNSGGTESNNTALHIVDQYPGCHVIVSSIEHDAVLEPCKLLESQGYDISYIPVTSSGMITPDSLTDNIKPNTKLVSIMFANNEVGTIQDIARLAEICHKHDILFHTDAVQAVGKVPIDVVKLGVDLLSMSSHKINGPKGVGALYIRDGIKISPIILGGGQERGLRSGTENVASIVGFGKACEIARNNLDSNVMLFAELRDTLLRRVLDEIPSVSVNGDLTSRLPNNIHFTFLGVSGEDLLIKLDEHGIAASTGSACSVYTQRESHVLAAMGLSHDQITGSLRLSVGIQNTIPEINETVDILKRVVKELRAVSPLKEKYSFA